MTKTARTAVCRLVRIDWETVGRTIKRVGGELLPTDRLGNLFEISLDEVGREHWNELREAGAGDAAKASRTPAGRC